MQSYSKESEGPSEWVHYNGEVESSLQIYSKVSEGPWITVDYNG
jgi:hypothetical protein